MSFAKIRQHPEFHPRLYYSQGLCAQYAFEDNNPVGKPRYLVYVFLRPNLLFRARAGHSRDFGAASSGLESVTESKHEIVTESVESVTESKAEPIEDIRRIIERWGEKLVPHQVCPRSGSNWLRGKYFIKLSAHRTWSLLPPGFDSNWIHGQKILYYQWVAVALHVSRLPYF